MFTVYLSPSEQNGNKYAYGDHTEREICEKIARVCAGELVARGVDVILEPEVPVTERVKHAIAKKDIINLYLPIHTNAFNGTVAGTRMFVRTKDSEPDYTICKAIFSRLDEVSYGESSNIKSWDALYEFKYTYPITACYAECDFHDHYEASKKLVEHYDEFGQAIAHGICDYLGIKWETEDYPFVRGEAVNVNDGVTTYANGKSASTWVIDGRPLYVLRCDNETASVTVNENLEGVTGTFYTKDLHKYEEPRKPEDIDWDKLAAQLIDRIGQVIWESMQEIRK